MNGKTLSREQVNKAIDLMVFVIYFTKEKLSKESLGEEDRELLTKLNEDAEEMLKILSDLPDSSSTFKTLAPYAKDALMVLLKVIELTFNNFAG